MSRPIIHRFELGEISRISDMEGRSRAEVTRLLIRIGLRVYRSKRSLGCGFRDCSRIGCCGGVGQGLMQRRGIRLVVDNAAKNSGG